jgi:hypothetical protein
MIRKHYYSKMILLAGDLVFDVARHNHVCPTLVTITINQNVFATESINLGKKPDDEVPR